MVGRGLAKHVSARKKAFSFVQRYLIIPSFVVIDRPVDCKWSQLQPEGVKPLRLSLERLALQVIFLFLGSAFACHHRHGHEGAVSA